MKRQQLIKLARLVATDSPELLSAVRAIQAAGDAEKRGTWAQWAKRFADWLESDGQAPFTIFARGNSKLPFYAFSALPLVTCPGAGACGKFCYSLKAWRYPAAFFRQCQNTLLILRQAPELREAFQALPHGVTVRLYVDGDIDSVKSLCFWFDQLRARPDISAYGYSKSWPIFLQFQRAFGDAAFPSNYRLNLSSGSRYGDDIAQQLESLPVYRGQFIAVPSIKQRKDGTNRAAYAASVRESAKALGHDRVFVCPGKCGECTKSGHACGLSQFNSKVIAIGIH